MYDKEFISATKKFLEVDKYKRDMYKWNKKYLHDDTRYQDLKKNALAAFESYDRKTYLKSPGNNSPEFIMSYLFLLNWDIADKMHLAKIYTDEGILDRSETNDIVSTDNESIYESILSEIAITEKIADRTLEVISRDDQNTKSNLENIKTQRGLLFHYKGILKECLHEIDEAIDAYQSSDTVASHVALLSIYVKSDAHRDIRKAEGQLDIILDRPVSNTTNPILLCQYKSLSVSIMYHDYFDQGEYEKALSILEDPRFSESLEVINDPFIRSLKEKWISDCQKCKEKLREKNEFRIDEKYLLEAGIKAENITKMTNDIKLMIMTSLSMYKFFVDNENRGDSELTIDFSAVIIPTLKACEAIFYHIIGKCYLQYLNDRKKDEELKYWWIPKDLKDKDGNLHDEVDMVEIGTAVHSALFYSNNQSGVCKYFKDFCNQRHLNLSNNQIVTHFQKLDDVRKIRNLAAHKNRVMRSDAIGLRTDLFETYAFIDKTYDLFGVLFE